MPYHTLHALFSIAQPALYTCVDIAEPATEPLKHGKLILRTMIEYPSLTNKTQELALISDLGLRTALSARYPLLTRLPKVEHILSIAQSEQLRALLYRTSELQADASFLSRLKTLHL
ncbi:hypothetical protein J1614_007545 [Plenodomus biglobosus]|nr:hypothetical protein J1614_007545 [Plenodomus biglobosus]